jgi:hypothetical protein
MSFEGQEIAKMMAPMELNRPFPREVRITTEGLWRASTAIVVLLIGLSWALQILVGFVRLKQHYEELKQGGRQTTATIDRVFTSVVYYSFACNGVVFTGKSGIPSSLKSRPKESDPLSILYLPSNPRVNHAVGWEETPIQGLGILVLPIGIVALGAWVAQDLRRTRQILRDGAVAAGTVKESSLYNRTGEIAVTYEFNTPHGGKREGTGWSEESLEQGKQIWILYLPNDPSVSTSYPLHHWRVAQ